jgi:hypothetical protein
MLLYRIGEYLRHPCLFLVADDSIDHAGAFPYIAKNDIDSRTGQGLELGILCMSAHSCQQAIKNISGQRIMKEYCQAVNRNSRVSKLIRMALEHRSDEGGSSRRSVGVPGFSDFRAVQSLADCESVKFHRALGGDELKDMEGEFLQALFKIQAVIVDVR